MKKNKLIRAVFAAAALAVFLSMVISVSVGIRFSGADGNDLLSAEIADVNLTSEITSDASASVPEIFTVGIPQKDISIKFTTAASDEDTEIIAVTDGSGRKIQSRHWFNVINMFSGHGTASHGLWYDRSCPFKYDGNYIWCRTANGKYVIVDCNKKRIGMTLSHSQLLIGVIFIISFVIWCILQKKTQDDAE